MMRSNGVGAWWTGSAVGGAGFSPDWRFSPARSKELVKALIAAHKPVQYIEIKSNHGHDAFLMEDEAYMRAVAVYMNNVDKDCRS